MLSVLLYRQLSFIVNFPFIVTHPPRLTLPTYPTLQSTSFCHHLPPSHSSRAPLTACHRYVRLCSTNDRGHVPLCFDATLVVISDAMVIHSFSERRSHVKYVSILFPPPGSTTLNKEHQERRPHTEKTFPEQDLALAQVERGRCKTLYPHPHSSPTTLR